MSERILIADDEGDMTGLLAFNFGRAGYSVATAADGSEAFEKARMFLPDVIILDIQMPGMDGLSVCRMLQNYPGTRRIPIFIITGHGDEQVRAASQLYGATDYLQKPFSPRDLVARVQAALARQVTD